MHTPLGPRRQQRQAGRCVRRWEPYRTGVCRFCSPRNKEGCALDRSESTEEPEVRTDTGACKLRRRSQVPPGLWAAPPAPCPVSVTSPATICPSQVGAPLPKSTLSHNHKNWAGEIHAGGIFPEYMADRFGQVSAVLLLLLSLVCLSQDTHALQKTRERCANSWAHPRLTTYKPVIFI